MSGFLFVHLLCRQLSLGQTDGDLRLITANVDRQFLQGLGIAQSMPGPLFNFSAYLGAVYQGVGGALVAWLGMFGPGMCNQGNVVLTSSFKVRLCVYCLFS